MRILLLLFLLSPVSALLRAQQRLTLSDAVLKAGTVLAPERLRGLQWIEGAQRYSYVKGEQLLHGGIGKGADGPLAELGALNAQLPDSAKLKAWPAFTWKSANELRFLHNQRLYAFDIASRELKAMTLLEPGAGNEEVEPATGAVAFVKDDDVRVMRPGAARSAS
ncbi:MAG: hypothetical protein ACK4L7_02155, partial [Flavobacteriales bacterium]